MFTIVEVQFCGMQRWVVVSDAGDTRCRPSSFMFALNCVLRWSY